MLPIRTTYDIIITIDLSVFVRRVIYVKSTTIPVVISSILLLCLSISFLFFINFKIPDYLAENELVYEECTFIGFKHIEEPHNRGAYTHCYYVYVDEYDAPLSIDSDVFDKVNQELLSELKPGDKITISVDKLRLRSMSCNSESILSYDDFLSEKKQSKLLEFIGSFALSCVCFVLSIAILFYYKKTGKWLLWGRR